MQIFRAIYAALSGEERPRVMLGLVSLLVLLLHVWVLLWLARPSVPVTTPQPLLMEVSLLPVSAPQPSAAPPAPPPPEKKAPPPNKPKPKPQKRPPVMQKTPEPLPAETAVPVDPAPRPLPTAVPKPAAPAPAASAAKSPKPETEKITEANYRANYASNPKPEYPRIARSRGWEGKVLLKVRVSAEGLSEAVSVHNSSGHEALDEAAAAAVEKWKFIPARRGDTPVASSVIVPIIFKLD